ncbi:uncharacterized protein LAESUDRAFT_728090 [Laetiporus sulphureus 93-53]|uniref:Uncharacterized protein n=1 Tax=Laetiporus sulphureus 93-53 TaxID=1314785 RepID=A0A165D7N0_9APHY|nr:uncharacterized protein LAESUDRAFT_728090 [Laetiporus sulphureus 93-53]KZT04285.1 hypothetical protein LAESUDRAFT_728090 [Laetiporus sulphureus 93-53]
MHSSFVKRLHASPTTLSFALVGFSLIVKVCATIWLKTLMWEVTREYTYLGDDYPEAWPIEIPNVLMASDNSMHFQLDTPDGIAEWSSIVPGESGLLHLGPHRQPFTVSMFHQLRCLNVIREELLFDRDKDDESARSELARHCLNYVKQMVLCRGDLQLEPFLAPSNTAPIDLYGTYECRDWGAVYKEIERNQLEYAQWREAQESMSGGL